MTLDNEKVKAQGNAIGVSKQVATDDGNATNPSVAALTSTSDSTNPLVSQSKANRESYWRKDVTLVVELLGLVALIVYTVFSVLQWSQIRWTNRLTREALDGNTYTLQETLKKMQLQADAMNRVADKSGMQVERLDASVQQSKRLAVATETSNSNVVAADRPWIGLEDYSISNFEEGKRPTLDFAVVNSGRRPALVELSFPPEVFSIGPFLFNSPRKRPLLSFFLVLL